MVALACRDAKGGASWQLLHGLLENAIYGGKVDNPFDGKVGGGLLMLLGEVGAS